MERAKLMFGSIVVMVFYVCSIVLFYVVAREQLTYTKVPENLNTSSAMTTVGQIVRGVDLVQPFVSKTDTLDELSLLTATYDRANTGKLTVEILKPDTHVVMAEKVLDMKDIPNNGVETISLDRPLRNIRGETFEIRISSTGTTGNAVTLYQNSNQKHETLLLNGMKTHNVLVFALQGKDYTWFGRHFFLVSLVVGVSLAAYLLYLIVVERKGKSTLGLRIILAFIKYKFLLSQLVLRDFKTKYKRSVLGILWSFLNPLLTMLVQYIIFSTLFRAGIQNFPVYLLVGVVLFNFFMESVSMSLMSIVGNASLITKVYVPKYIYPVSRVLSSTINLLLAIIPLFIVILFTNTRITPAYLLLPIGIVFIVIFCIGLGMLMSSAMVYFRDTQFLWSVVSMLWMYFTPIFYPASIIPERFMLLYKMNPLYHFILFVRVIVLQGTSPAPNEYFYCGIFAFGMLVLGALVFKKSQNGFVLNI